MSLAKPLIVKCPQCSLEHEWSSDNRYRPFCSERCKQIDLGAWASERYQIEGTEVMNSHDDPSTQYPQ